MPSPVVWGEVPAMSSACSSIWAESALERSVCCRRGGPHWRPAVINSFPVHVDETGIHKAIGTLATTHILKPPIRAAIPLPHTVENEAFCMQLAGKLGLVVVCLMWTTG